MHLHKQSLEALLRFKASQVNISQTLHKELNALKSKPSAHSLKRVTSCPDFNYTKAEMLQNSGTMGQLVGKYVRDVSATLSFVASFREREIWSSISKLCSISFPCYLSSIIPTIHGA